MLTLTMSVVEALWNAINCCADVQCADVPSELLSLLPVIRDWIWSASLSEWASRYQSKTFLWRCKISMSLPCNLWNNSNWAIFKTMRFPCIERLFIHSGTMNFPSAFMICFPTDFLRSLFFAQVLPFLDAEHCGELFLLKSAEWFRYLVKNK